MKILQCLFLSALLLISGALVACQPGTTDGTALEGTVWLLESYTSETGTHHVLDGTGVTLVFDKEEKQLGGNAGCNHYGAPYEIKGSRLELTDHIVQTLMACIDEAVMDQEYAYLKALAGAEEYKVKGDVLTITGGGFELTFRAKAGATITTTPTLPDVNPLARTFWRLVSYTDETGTHPALDQTDVTLNFDAGENQFGGIAGCNQYGGEYALDGSALTTGSIYQTDMYCNDEAVMEQERDYLQALGTAGNYEIVGDTLTITGGGWTLEFERYPAEAVNPLAGTNWVLVSYCGEMGTRQALDGAPVTLSFERMENRLGGVAGCNHYGAEYEMGGNSFLITGPVTQTKMYCTGEGIMEQEQHYLEALGVAQAYQVENDTLTITGSGWTLQFARQ